MFVVPSMGVVKLRACQLILKVTYMHSYKFTHHDVTSATP
jgi:hypothetical protein